MKNLNTLLKTRTARLIVTTSIAITIVAGSTQIAAATVNEPSSTLYADPDSPANQVLRTQPTNKVAAAIAAVPQARWFTPDTSTANVRSAVARYVDGAANAGAIPVLVMYAIPGRDCGGYSAGGLPNAAAYAAWIQQVRAGIGTRSAGIIVEPDALTSADCLSTTARDQRYAMLSNAVSQLSAGGNTKVYLDGGHSRWLSVTELARRLRLAGVANAKGFSLNISNFFTTAEEQQYGEQVSTQLSGKRYVVDISRNGRGPAPDAPLNWCNPLGRGLGTNPTLQTTAAHNDANLWIKNPGQSDGTCDRGDPYSGYWFQARAAEMLTLRTTA